MECHKQITCLKSVTIEGCYQLVFISSCLVIQLNLSKRDPCHEKLPVLADHILLGEGPTF